MKERQPGDWWGTYRVPAGRMVRWRIGPLNLWMQRLAGEWRLAHTCSDDPNDSGLEIEVPDEETDITAIDSFARFVFGSDDEEIHFVPLLADRPVVTNSEKPLHIPPGEEVKVYVASPLWIRITVGRARKKLVEIPLFRPSDTWFGPSTLEGELCYATRTFHRLQLEQLPARPHRALTTVLVKNRADSLLSLEKMQVPVMHLGLYRAESGRVWTEDVIFTREGPDDFAALRTRAIHESKWKKKATLVAGPRLKADDNIMVRAFGSIFG